MSKPVKELVRKELTRRFQGLTSLAVVGFTGLDGNATNRIRGRLREKDIHITVVRNALAKQAFHEIGLDVAGQLLDGPCAIAYGSENVVAIVRELLEIHQEYPGLTVKAAVLEGEAFGAERVEALSKFPTLAEARAKIVSGLLAPGARLAACLLGPGGRIASILKAIADKGRGPQGEADEAPPQPAPPPAGAAPSDGETPAKQSAAEGEGPNTE